MLDAATEELSRLDKKVARRIAGRIEWLAENWENAKSEALKGDLAGLLKLRVGDYRVIYELIVKEELLVVHFVGHRREVYKRR
jgi:mRNA interferase RelE/StbE